MAMVMGLSAAAKELAEERALIAKLEKKAEIAAKRA